MENETARTEPMWIRDASTINHNVGPWILIIIEGNSHSCFIQEGHIPKHSKLLAYFSVKAKDQENAEYLTFSFCPQQLLPRGNCYNLFKEVFTILFSVQSPSHLKLPPHVS